jgi:hypothetical protein
MIIMSTSHNFTEQEGIVMAKNTGDNYRHGAVDNRSQVLNPKNDLYVKRNDDTGRFMDVKTSSPTPFKGVRKEK